MKSIFIVLKTEFINTFTRRSFLLTLILVPLVPAVLLGGFLLLRGNEQEMGIGELFQQAHQETQKIEGYIDQAGIIIGIPEWAGSQRLIKFTDEIHAHEALISGEITSYYIIPPDYINDGIIHQITTDFNPMTIIDTTNDIKLVIRYNLLENNAERFQLFHNPIHVQYIDLEPDDSARDMANPLAFYLPYAVTMLFYVLIFTSASLMLNSVAKEKENRVMEILMSSINPRLLLAGKIFGLGLVGLLQMIVWMGSGILLLQLAGNPLNIPAELQLPPNILYWGIVFFILGYLIYGTIMAGAGALVPNIKEATQATFIIILPLTIPLGMVGAIINQPNAAIPIILSLIPFTAPSTIMTRLAVAPVPLWQLLLSIGLMVLTIFLLIRAVAGIFRAQILLTGQKFKLSVFLKLLFSKNHQTT